MEFIDSESNNSDGSSEYSDSEESLVRPTFIPKHQRLTLVQEERRKSEENLKEEKKKLEETLRKNKTRAIVAENIRKMSENTYQADQDGNNSEAGIPDCSENDLDDQLEVSSVYRNNYYSLLYFCC